MKKHGYALFLIIVALCMPLGAVSEVYEKAISSIGGQEGQKPLIKAVEEAKIKTVSALLDDPRIDPNAKDDRGETALMIAIRKGYLNIIDALLANPRVDLNIEHPQGHTALSLAGILKRVEVIDRLLANRNIEPLQVRNLNRSEISLIEQTSNLRIIARSHEYNHEIIQRLFKEPLLRAEYRAILLGNLIDLENIALPGDGFVEQFSQRLSSPYIAKFWTNLQKTFSQSTHESLIEAIFREGSGMASLSIAYLIDTWNEFKQLPFGSKYEPFEVLTKGTLGNLINSWKQGKIADNQALSHAIKKGKPCSWTVRTREHLMGMSVRKNHLIFANLGGAIDLGNGKPNNANSLLGEMVFDISSAKDLFTPSFIGKLRESDTSALETLYQLPKIGYIGKKGQTRSNCAFVHPNLFIENHIYLTLLGNEKELTEKITTNERDDWESTTLIDTEGRKHQAERILPSGEIVRCLNQDTAVKHARRIFRDFTLFGRIKALADFANDPHAVEYMRAILPEEHKGEAERLVNEAIMESWKKISEMIQKRTAYKAAEEPDWTKRGYNTVEGRSIVDGLLERLGDDPTTEAAKLLRSTVMEAKTISA